MFNEMTNEELMNVDGGNLTWSGVCKVAITATTAVIATTVFTASAPVIIGGAVVGYVASEALIED